MDPRLLTCWGNGETGRRHEVMIEEMPDIQVATAGRNLRIQLLHGHLCSRLAICDDGAVGVKVLHSRQSGTRHLSHWVLLRKVLEWARDGRRRRENTMERLTTMDEGLGPDKLLHRMRRLNPWASTLTPTRRTRNSHLESELIGLLRREEEGILPLRRHIDQALVDNLRSIQRCIEVLEPSDTYALHPVEVAIDSLFRYIAVHPVPPYAWLCRIRRRLKSALQ